MNQDYCVDTELEHRRIYSGQIVFKRAPRQMLSEWSRWTAAAIVYHFISIQQISQWMAFISRGFDHLCLAASYIANTHTRTSHAHWQADDICRFRNLYLFSMKNSAPKKKYRISWASSYIRTSQDYARTRRFNREKSHLFRVKTNNKINAQYKYKYSGSSQPHRSALVRIYAMMPCRCSWINSMKAKLFV